MLLCVGWQQMSKRIYNYESPIPRPFSLAKPCDYNYRRLEHAGYTWRTGREKVFFSCQLFVFVCPSLFYRYCSGII